MIRFRRQTSLGGTAVELGLRSLGFELAQQDVALVETRIPKRDAYRVVLAQNSWNVIPRSEFARRLRDYSLTMWPRIVARRVVAAVNLRRASSVVCMTESMGELVRRHIHDRTPVVVSPVWAVSDMPSVPATGEQQAWALVPGTLTAYKNPMEGLRVAHALGIRSVLFAGEVQQGRLWTELQKQADVLSVTVECRTLSRDEMATAMRSARVVILPSLMESLGFGLAEALVAGRHVLASPIPAHREIARRLGREPGWLPDVTGGTGSVAVTDPAQIRASWESLGAALGLQRGVSDEPDA